MIPDTAVYDGIFLLKGVIIGLCVSIPIGPAAILFLRRSLYYGPVAGFASGLGIAAGDTFYGTLAALGMSHFALHITEWYEKLKGGAGLLLVVIGIYFLFKNQDFSYTTPKKQSHIQFFLTTFFLTLLNPFILFLFAILFTSVGLESFQRHLDSVFFLIVGILAGSISWWILLLGVIQKFFPERRKAALFFNRFSGLLFLVFGTYVSWTTLVTFLKLDL